MHRSLAWLVLLFGASVLAVGAACSDSSSDKPSAAVDAAPEAEPDSGEPEVDAGETNDLEPTGETSLESVINGVSRPLDRAQYGITKEPSGESFYFEAHEGGEQSCPESVTPNRTLIVNGVPKGAAGESFDESNGITAAFLDFAGDQITTDDPTTKATAVKATIIQVTEGESVEIEIEATFPEGTVTGRISATYCEAMSSDSG